MLKTFATIGLITVIATAPVAFAPIAAMAQASAPSTSSPAVAQTDEKPPTLKAALKKKAKTVVKPVVKTVAKAPPTNLRAQALGKKINGATIN